MSFFHILLVLLALKNVALMPKPSVSIKSRKYEHLAPDDQIVLSRIDSGRMKPIDTDKCLESGTFSDITPIYDDPQSRDNRFSLQERLKLYFSNSLLVDNAFKSTWISVLEYMEDAYRSKLPNDFTLLQMIKAKSLLMAAIESDDPYLVTRAINSGAIVLINYLGGVISTTNYTPIELAVTGGKVSALNVMLGTLRAAIANPETNKNYRIFLGGLLIRAVQAGSERSFNFLLENYKAKYIEGSFLFQQAITRRAPISIVARILKEFSGHAEVYMPYGRHLDFPLHLAIKFNHPEAFAYIFTGTTLPKVNYNRDALLPIHLLFSSSRDTFIVTLFSRHPELKHRFVDEFGNTFLHLLAQYNRFDQLKLVMSKIGFDLSYVNYIRQTALHVACFCMNMEIAAYLIQSGANVLAEDSKGITPLLLLARDNDHSLFGSAVKSIEINNQVNLPTLPRTVQALIQEYKYEFVDKLFGRFPKLLKCQFFYESMSIQDLISTSKIFDYPNIYRQFLNYRFFQSPYHLLFQAAAKGKTEIVKISVEAGLRLDLTDDKNRFAIDLAILNRHSETARFLLQLTGWNVVLQTGLNNFIFVLCNGGSFSPESPSKVNFSDRSLIFSLFLEYFSHYIYPKSTLNLQELATICAQYDVFIHFHFINRTVSDAEIASVQQIEFCRTEITKSHFNLISTSEYSPILTMLKFYPSKNASFLRKFIKFNSIGKHLDPQILKDFLTSDNLGLLVDYSSIL